MIRKLLMITTMAMAGGQAGATGLMDSSLEDPRVALLNEEQRDICDREELDPAELAWLRRSPDFDLILNEALENCPEIALLLVEQATATTRQEPDERDGPSGGNDGFRDRSPKDDPKDEPEDEPQDQPDDEPQDEPDDEPQDEPDDEPQDEPDDEPQDEPNNPPSDKP